MPHEVNDRIKKRGVICMNCKHTFSSQVKKPHCSECKSTNVVDVNSISDKMAVSLLERKINERLDSIELVIDELCATMEYIKDTLEQEVRYRGQIVKEMKIQAEEIGGISKH